MPSFSALLVPLALLLPFGAVGGPTAMAEGDWSKSAQLKHGLIDVPAANRQSSPRALPIDGQSANQVRIQRRVILRISPRVSSIRRNFMGDFPDDRLPPRLVERRMGNCVEVAGIAGVQAGRGNRLMLFMHDRRMIAAHLEKSCSARDFYSGFYIERNEDGRLCVERDRLQSRAGAKCELSRMRNLVAVED